MIYRKRLKYTEEQKSYIWDRYKQGDAVKAIARASVRTSSSIHGLLAVTGGIRPAERKRSPRRLSLAEREEISRGLVSGLSMVNSQFINSMSSLAIAASAIDIYLPHHERRDTPNF